jgi:F0F1-type ATP synthase membrane subunit b/b'
LDKQIVEEEREGEEYEMNLRVNTKAPTVAEIKKALKELRSGKAAGVDNISQKVLKVNLDITANMLHLLFERYGMKVKCQTTGDVVY